jgi:hypothetical protein
MARVDARQGTKQDETDRDRQAALQQVDWTKQPTREATPWR